MSWPIEIKQRIAIEISQIEQDNNDEDWNRDDNNSPDRHGFSLHNDAAPAGLKKRLPA
jgi:hypothetical protein